jgi:hypothetical protein
VSDHLTPGRLEEIRDLLARLAAGPADEADAHELLDASRTALTALLDDRDDLTRAHQETAEELALWTGAL